MSAQDPSALLDPDVTLTCGSPEQYDAILAWARDHEVALDAEVDPDTGEVTFRRSPELPPGPPRSLEVLLAVFHGQGSVVLRPDEVGAFDAWVRTQNVPVHRQVDRTLDRVVIIRRGWGTVEM